MVLSEKPIQMEGESDSRKWIISGVQTRSSLKLIFTISSDKPVEEEDECSTTPTAEEARIPAMLECPPAPRKPKASSRYHYDGVKQFLNPPHLETLFRRRLTQKA
jgi:hypothetical protein